MILNYTNYIQFIKEGLISTHNIEKYHDSLEIELNSVGIKNEIEIKSKFVYVLNILNSNELDDNLLRFIIDINQNLLGYYPSYIWVKNNFGINGFVFDEKYLSNKYSNIKIRFEAKYEDGLYKNDLEIPEFAYHLSPDNKKNKILKDGLCPKSYNRKTKHPDRLFLFYNLDDYETLLKSLKWNDKINDLNRNYTLYKVKLNDKMIIHTDPNYSKGFYTYDNVSPKNIEILKEGL
jgi:hypothetical protein